MTRGVRSQPSDAVVELRIGARGRSHEDVDRTRLAILGAFLAALASCGAFALTLAGIDLRWAAASSSGAVASASLATWMYERRRREHGAVRLRVSGDRVALVEGGHARAVFELGPLFGVHLFGDTRRSRLVAWLSSQRQTLAIGATLDPSSRASLHGRLLRSTTLSDDDATLHALGPEGLPIDLEARDLERLLVALEGASPGCLDRIVASDQRGRPLVLAPPRLDAGDLSVDLARPLEWHAGLFQEELAGALGVYQGTWLRQDDREVVLVAPMTATFVDAALGGLPLSSENELDELARRDQRLLQALARPAPPSHLRVAIDAPLVGPVRAALERAPRAPRPASTDRSLS
jgi:hypothetical protein